MTLTAILPSLRSTLPDPFEPALWPSSTVLSTTDVLVDGRSLLQEARTFGLPFLRSADQRSVLVAAVFARVETFDDRIDLVLDASDDLDGVWTEARLIGRISHARAGGVRMSTRTRWQGEPCRLPRDASVGDLVAVPMVLR